MRRVLAFIVALAVSAMAHPHVFADVSVVAEFDQGGFSGIKNHWVYDELYSAAMAASMGYDGKAFSKEANEKLSAMAKEETVSTLNKVLLTASEKMKNGYSLADN